MTDPRRWLDEGAPDHVRELLHAGTRSRALPDAVRQRSARRVAALAALPVGFAALITSSGTVLAAAAGVGLGVAVAVGGPALLAEAPAPAAPAASASSGHARRFVVPRAAPPPAAALPPESRLEPPVPAAPAPPRQAADSLLEEAQLLERARNSLAASPAAALELLDDHARRFPRGKLATERQLLQIDALQRAGRHAEARARADRLRKALAGTIYEPRLKQLMAE